MGWDSVQRSLTCKQCIWRLRSLPTHLYTRWYGWLFLGDFLHDHSALCYSLEKFPALDCFASCYTWTVQRYLCIIGIQYSIVLYANQHSRSASYGDLRVHDRLVNWHFNATKVDALIFKFLYKHVLYRWVAYSRIPKIWHPNKSLSEGMSDK